MEDRGRILGVDPGEKRIGVAVSDPTQTIASALPIVRHVSLMVDAAAVAQVAAELSAVRIVVGYALDSEGLPGPQARKAERFAEALRAQTGVPVELWDESGSTQQARQVRRQMGGSRRSRQGHLDSLAAAVILQSYLEAQRPPADRIDDLGPFNYFEE